jgi:hypothetical protein
LSFCLITLFVAFWFNDIIIEATFEGHHTQTKTQN